MSERRSFDPRRVAALMRKETLQIVRDPSAILIAFVLPVILLFLFAYAVSLDLRNVRIGVVLESDGPESQSLAAAFAASRYFDVTPARDRREVMLRVVAGELRGMVVIPADFDDRFSSLARPPQIQTVTDGSQPNTANFVAGYANGVFVNWLAGRTAGRTPPPRVSLEPRFWFNPEIESRRFLLPGAVAIVMTLIGTMLTALVVAREWERGTMEALLSTPARKLEILIGKLLPYFVLGLIATLGCAILSITVFNVPLRGSWFSLIALSSAFLVPALGQGLLVSAATRDQFLASQIALFSGYLPAFLLSGFLYPIDSMPWPLRVLTRIVPARYFVEGLQTVFLSGDIWSQLLPLMAAMLAIGSVLFALASRKTPEDLDT